MLTETGYRQQLADSDSDEDEDRLANIEELLTSAREFDRATPEGNYLESFLEQVSLVSDTDEFEAENDRVTLMTLHAAKGLEFPVVFIVAAEEGLLPHERSRDDPAQLEEERRLLFVGITRAEEELEISLAKQREFRGSRRYCVPSRFLMELPREEMEVVEPPAQWQDGFDTDEFETEEFEEAVAIQSPPPRIVASDSSGPRVMTAAEMLTSTNEAAPPIAVDPEVFKLAMVVTHPQHGIGKVVALSGNGKKRTATVDFVSAGRRTYRLAQSPLKPVAKS